jgi:starch phosphorylase
MRTAEHINAVSALHGEVTRSMWRGIWPDTPADRLPVRFITNGVHLPTWMSARVLELLTSALGDGWVERADDATFAEGLAAIPDAELWALREQLRLDLFEYVRERIRSRWADERVGPNRVVAAGAMLDPHVLTIGYARRFTAYKRPELIFHDPDRLARILNNVDRPVQIVFAGKAHPADEPAKLHLQRVFKHCLDPAFGGRIAFVDDYDMHVAHYLVHGCDVWLNTPRKPLEASGTSGMKAAMNGVPHLSIGDGWWAEGYNGANGWLIEGQAQGEDQAAMDAADAEALYTLLEQEVVAAFYDRNDEGLPSRWLEVVRESMRASIPRFSTRRMLKQYVTEMYAPAAGTAVAPQ